ncbi:MAG: hypothetical protein N3F09_07180 [Bacteroidia bacterium]|nr:hypothetical protein [Bacteroidia bacterium]
MKKNILKYMCAVLLLATACKKDPKDNHNHDNNNNNNNPPATGKIVMEFDAVMNGQAFQFDTMKYANSLGQGFKLGVFKHYVSNVKLTKTDNSLVELPETYFIVDYKANGGNKITLENVPSGAYKSASFMLGVDSARNVSGAQTGALSPSNGMFWSWNTGYIFLKAEGHSSVSSSPDKSIVYHIGGFSGANKAQRIITLPFGNHAANVGTSTPTIHILCRVDSLFSSVHDINFSTMPKVHMPGANSKKIADNYATMFFFDHIH